MSQICCEIAATVTIRRAFRPRSGENLSQPGPARKRLFCVRSEMRFRLWSGDVHFTDALQRNSIGKVQKTQLHQLG